MSESEYVVTYHGKRGLMVDTPSKRYGKVWPEKILITLEREKPVISEEDQLFTYSLTYQELYDGKDPDDQEKETQEWEGKLRVSVKDFPENKRLVTLLNDVLCIKPRFIVFLSRCLFSQLEVKGMEPGDERWMSNSLYRSLIKRAGIRFELPEETEAKRTPISQRRNELLYAFHMFRDCYPPEMQEWMEEHLPNCRMEEVRKFLEVNWKAPDLILPSKEVAKLILDANLYGMEPVKEQILKLLEMVRRSGKLAHNILLVGPEGVGKTSVAQAIAKIIHLPMSILPMACLQDVDTFCGFAQTYSGAQEGELTSALMAPKWYESNGKIRPAQQIAQVLFLNELDKVGIEKGKGSVQSVLLRMLDDNRSFFDVYHQMTIPLENVMVVADANDKTVIQRPLLDRFFVIEVPGYTSDEKRNIFHRHILPRALKQWQIEESELEVSDEAVERIVSRTVKPGVRELKYIADDIVGDFLLHHGQSQDTVCYTPEMVTPLLPETVRRTHLERRPGCVPSVVLWKGSAMDVNVQCKVERNLYSDFHLYGCTDALVQQELEASCRCAQSYLPDANYDIAIQIYGLNESVTPHGQLGLAVFMAVLSAFYDFVVTAPFYGSTTLLGGLTCGACDDPDAVLYGLDSRQGWLYTALGFTERVRHSHQTRVVELANAEAAVGLCMNLQTGQQAV